jgi:hypothetical protein
MKKLLQIITFLFVFVECSYSQSFNYIDDHCFGTLKAEEGSDMTRLNQLNVIVGNSFSVNAQQDKTESTCDSLLNPGEFPGDFWVVAFDDSLHKKWDKTYGTTSINEQGASIIPYRQGILIAGETAGDSSCSLVTTIRGDRDYILLFIDSLGNKINELRLGSVGCDKNCIAEQALDGGLLLSGFSNGVHGFDKTQHAFYYPSQTPYQAGFDFWAIKLDTLGNKQWDCVFGGMGNEYPDQTSKKSGLTVLNDSNYLIYGSTSSGIGGNITTSPISPPGFLDAIVFKVDKNGNKIWDKRFGCDGWTNLNKIIEKDNYYYFFGLKYITTFGTIPLENDFWIMKTDTSGNLIWEKKFGTTESDFWGDIIQNPQGGFFALGAIPTLQNGAYASSTFSNPAYGDNDIVIMSLDTAGSLLTYKIIGHNKSNLPNSLTMINDSTILISATAANGISNVKNDAGRGDKDIWVVKLGYSTTTTSINQLQNNFTLTVQPNPAHDQINFSGLPPATYTINTYSLDGRLVMSDIVTSDLSLLLSIESLQSGMYITSIRNEKINTTVRWVKE